ncbi:hypothetical protein TNCV_3064951 [Trichonephila clavipes]|nr:hypothetical protein TNCV_3064951 [Trichonephila clavipes]
MTADMPSGENGQNQPECASGRASRILLDMLMGSPSLQLDVHCPLLEIIIEGSVQVRMATVVNGGAVTSESTMQQITHHRESLSKINQNVLTAQLIEYTLKC